MVSYIPKKKKVVILLSTMHHDKLQVEEKKNKPEIILYCNKSTGGVDTIDQMVQYYTNKKAIKKVANDSVVQHD